MNETIGNMICLFGGMAIGFLIAFVARCIIRICRKCKRKMPPVGR